MLVITMGQTLLLVGGRLCLDFCNTVEYRIRPEPVELLRQGYQSLLRWSELVGIADKNQIGALEALSEREPELCRAAFEKAIALREASYSIFDSIIEKREIGRAALDTVNAAVSEAFARRALVPAGNGLAWAWKADDDPEAMLAPIALSIAEVLTKDDLGRLSRCPGCGWLFYDQSKNRGRTWCDMRFCGNREKARRHSARSSRARKSGARGGG